MRWAGNPHKPALPGNDPRDLSPRRSFAVWTERVRGTARAWLPAEVEAARAVGASLRDVVLQVRSMSYLITEDRLARLRRALQASADGVLIADGEGRIRFVERGVLAFLPAAARAPGRHGRPAPPVPRPAAAREMVRAVMDEERSWRGELQLDAGGGASSRWRSAPT